MPAYLCCMMYLAGCGMLEMWNVEDTRCWRGAMLGMMDVWDVGCWECGILGI